MSEKVARMSRRHENQAARKAVEAIAPNVEAALYNENVTRGRVEALEEWARKFSTMSRWERVKWLLR